MALIRWTPQRDLWDPFAQLSEIQEDMNRLFDVSRRRYGSETVFSPAMDLVEEKERFVVKAELPGLTKSDVNVTLQDNILTVRGEKKLEAETKEASYYLSERVYGQFSRTIRLPSSVDAKKIEATFKDGVLQVILPKTEEARPKQIDVKLN